MTDLGTTVARIDDAEREGRLPPDRPRVVKSTRTPFPIDVRSGALPAMTATAWRGIVAHNDPARLFAVAGRPARLIGAGTGTAKTEELTVDMLGRETSNSVWWHKQDKDFGEVEQFPVERVLRNMLADPAPPLPRLDRILQAPTYGASGALTIEPGYHGANHHYLATSLSVPPPPVAPSTGEVENALHLLLDEFLGDFPFTGDAERAHALSCLLNPFVRDLIDGPTPIYFIEAPTPGTGKSLLATMLMVPALGRAPKLLSPAANDDEMQKILLSVLSGLPEAVQIDNVEGLSSRALAEVLTADVWSGRVLGRTETRDVPVRCTWLGTGNNPTFKQDMARRRVRIRLSAPHERPDERSGWRHPHLGRWALANRGDLIGAALTLVQAWLAAGRPAGTVPFGGFDGWAEVHGGILDVCNVPGFLANRRESDALAVNEEAAWRAFVAAWWMESADKVVTAKEIFAIAREIDDFPLGRAGTERGERSAFGQALSRNRDRIYGGYRIVAAGRAHQAATYQLAPVGEGE